MRSAGLDRPVESGAHLPLPCAPQVTKGTGDALPQSIEVMVPGFGPLTLSTESPLPPRFRPLLPTDARQKFWLNPEAWPRNAPGKVFLARAVDVVGKAMFSEWSGWEPTVDLLLQPLPAYRIAAGEAEVRKALDALPPMTEAESAATMAGLALKGIGKPPADMTPEVRTITLDAYQDTISGRWAQAVAMRAETINAIQPLRDRLAAVERWLEDAMLEGRLKYYLRHDPTGAFGPALPPYWWNGEHGAARFYFCRMNALTPITPAVSGTGFQSIFVDDAELKLLVDAMEAENAPMRNQAMQRRFTAKLLEAARLSPKANPHTKEWWKALARSDEYHLTVPAFDDAWEQLDTVPGCTWRAPGKRSKTPQETPR